MPRLSDSMEEGTVARWLVEVGAEVTPGLPIVEIDTDKATMEYEAERAGTLLKIVVAEGGTAPIGATIAWIGEAGETVEQPSDTVLHAPAPAPAPAAETAASATAPPASPRVNASPIAKRIAGQLGVDLAGLPGTGPNGMITKEDVEAAAAGRGGHPGAEAAVPLSRVQQVIARHMAEAAAVPTFAIEMEIDMTACATLRESLDPRPSYNDFVVKACALALREHPRVNASFADAGYRYAPDVNVGIAVAADDALLVPVVHHADEKSLADIRSETRALADNARAGKLTPAELDGGTFTVSNLGMHGVHRFEALLNTPQAAILAVGAVEPRPVVVGDGAFEARPLLTATLVCDHRILYGADGAAFLARVRELLEDPAAL